MVQVGSQGFEFFASFDSQLAATAAQRQASRNLHQNYFFPKKYRFALALLAGKYQLFQ